MSRSDPTTTSPVFHPDLGEASRVWLKIGLLSFGGPAAQIALMHREVVETRSWLTEAQFLNALSFCMLLPGPEAMQLATYAGWRLNGTLGGLIAGLSFVLPGAAVIMILAAIYSLFGDVPLVAALFYGVKAAVLVIVTQALVKLSQKALGARWHWAIAGLAFVGIFFFSVPFPIIVILAALTGVTLSALAPTPIRLDARPTVASSARLHETGITICVWLVIWALPFAVVYAVDAPDLLRDVGVFFSTLAVVTFGGAYAVLAYMAQDVVGQFGWLTAGEMVDALGLAETTPGPLILVTQFVGFLAGFKDGGVWLGVSAALMALWVTFTPCFLWIFTGAPYIEWIAAQPKLKGALSGVTAAVVGVILNLSLWFALHVLFADVVRYQFGWMTFWLPNWMSLEVLAAVLFGLSCVLAFRFNWGVIRLLALVAVIGAIARLTL